jgi:hypothetical protein
MYYRRKVILGLMQLLGGKSDKIRLQKLLFLYGQRKREPEYEFVPYKFGCYSYSMNADLNTMVKKDFLREDNSTLQRADSKDYLCVLKKDDQTLLADIAKSYGGMSNNTLIKHTYINYPYFATKSEIAEELLNQEQLNTVSEKQPRSDSTTLFTVGYEGISLEKYLNKLLLADVKVLVDVRKNPLSMKYGFSKTLLTRFCNSLGIEYLHLPQVGIKSEHRRELNTQADYDQLFKVYKKTTLTESVDTQELILKLLSEKKRIALTCFEADVCQCHRKHLAESIESLHEFTYEVKHI